MKKNTVYIIIAALAGILAGALIFSGNSGAEMGNDLQGHDHSGEQTEQMWTCSMHPQIMQPEPGSCPICGMDLIPADSDASGLALNEIRMTRNAMELANVMTTTVGSQGVDGSPGLTLSGKIQVNKEAIAVQASYFDGRIEKLNVTFEGQEINKGQLLASIYAPKLIAAQQELITAAGIRETQPALYNAVRNKLKQWKLSEEQINAIEESGQVREYFPVYATVTGTVSEVMAREGDYVTQGQPLLRLANLNSVWASFDAYENQIPMIEKGMPVTLTTNAYPNREFQARVSFIDPVLNTQTRTVVVRATLDNKEGNFKPGMFVKGRLQTKGTTLGDEAIVIPASALMWTGERSLVYVKTRADEPVFEMREVTIAQRNGENYTISSGLERGEEIVTHGTFTVDAAAQLQGKQSMMNRQAGGDNSAHQGHGTGAINTTLPANIQTALLSALGHYFQLKDALVEGNAAAVARYSNQAAEAFDALPDDQADEPLRSSVGTAVAHFNTIAGLSDIEKQREHFVILNRDLIPLARGLRKLDHKIYVQHCPMANNNQGANWLSFEREIRNPYYGEAMLSCGSVMDSIQ